MFNGRQKESRFFIVGAAKSGTTSLYHYLKGHPEIFFPQVKEPNYFANIESDYINDYDAPKKNVFYHSKVIRDFQIYENLYMLSNENQLLGDASPSYLFDKESARRIKDVYPQSKIIIILRDPIERAFSHYLMDFKNGRQKEDSFYKALLNDVNNNRPKKWGVSHLYMELGLYYKQVRRYIDVFDRDRVLILSFNDLNNDEVGFVDRVLNFLNVSQEYEFDVAAKNEFQYPRNYISKLLIQNKRFVSRIAKFIPRQVKSRLRGVLLNSGCKPEIEEDARNYLIDAYQSDLRMLRDNLDIDFYELVKYIK